MREDILVTSILATIVAYSVIINYLFGHPTYWRRIHKEVFNYFKSLTKQFLIQPNQQCKLILERNHATSNSELSLSSMDIYVLFNILSFLSPYDIVNLSQTSQKFRNVCDDKIVWELHGNFLLCKLYTLFHNKTLNFDQPSCSFQYPKIRYFILYFYARNCVLEQFRDTSDSRCVVKVNGKIFDLTDFQHKHAGGHSILCEWNGNDATRIFNLAGHSKLARDLSEKYIIWSDKDIIGRKGYPMIMREYISG